jgi:hypothetical protein
LYGIFGPGPAAGHTPFPQWKVYRKLHLFIVVNRQDPVACELGDAIALTLATELPESRALVTHARDALRLASLISTQQLDVALVHHSELAAWRQGESPYDSAGTFRRRFSTRSNGWRKRNETFCFPLPVATVFLLRNIPLDGKGYSHPIAKLNHEGE